MADIKVFQDNLNSLFSNDQKTIEKVIESKNPRPEVIKMLQKHVKRSHPKIVEQGIYNYTLEQCKNYDVKCHWDSGPFLSIYAYKVKDIIKNLMENSNLKKNMKNNKDAYEISEKSKDQLQPNNWEFVKERRRSMKEARSFKEGTDAFKCKRCGESKSELMQAQTRSADEPMTTFITCLHCGHRMKFS